MVKLTGQLISYDASGSIGKTLTYSSWKGRPYAKQYTVPSDPNTALQIGIRQAMGFLSTQWASLSASDGQTWKGPAGDRQITLLDAFNATNLVRFSQNKGLSKAYPPAEASNSVALISELPTASERFVTLGASTGPITEAWGYVFYQDKSSGFTPHPGNAVSVIFGAGLFTVRSARVVPPSAGIWYSRYASFNATGTLKLIAIERSVTWPP